MMKKSILALTLVAFTAPFAGAAFAGPGADQLAAQLGVTPGAYSLSQLVQLQSAKDDNDTAAFNFILSQGSDVSARADSTGAGSVSPGAAQLAASLGVQPGSLSLADLTSLDAAVRDNDAQAIAFILNGSDDGSNNGGISAGRAQLAAGLGLNPADYTTAELAQKFLNSID